ncbi:helix-turn-helix domain-containing protein [Streptococcus hyointestinalis]|nr:helix-turn-helix transcriptional regulator [Streptococcus hyointestinalis]
MDTEKLIANLKLARSTHSTRKRRYRFINPIAAGIKIREIRLENNLSMQSLADRTGITRGVINNIEKGRIVSPRYSVIEKIVALSRQYRTPDDFIKEFGEYIEPTKKICITLSNEERQHIIELLEKEQQEHQRSQH